MTNHASKKLSNDTPIFIIGTERSGSNLLRLILNAHSHICVPHPPHIIQYFKPLEKFYDDLNNSQNLDNLIKNILALLNTHIYPWDIKIDANQISENLTIKNIFGIFFRIYDIYLDQTNKQRWGCKSTFLIHDVKKILHYYSSAKFIWLVRDPRDVAASSKKSVFSPYHPFYTSLLWQAQQQEGFNLLESLSEKNIQLFLYEDLINSPENTVTKICNFIEEPYEPQMLDYYKDKPAQKSSQLSASWKKAASPILSNNQSKFSHQLSKNDIEIIETLTSPLMKKFGYTIKTPEIADQKPAHLNTITFKPTTLQKIKFAFLNSLWKIQVEVKSLFQDKNHWLRWSRALLLKRLWIKGCLRYYFLNKKT